MKEVSKTVLRNWHTAELNDLREALSEIIDELGGMIWVEKRPDILQCTDDVLHARGFRIAAGWKPPRGVSYGDTVLYLDDEWVERIFACLARKS